MTLPHALLLLTALGLMLGILHPLFLKRGRVDPTPWIIGGVLIIYVFVITRLAKQGYFAANLTEFPPRVTFFVGGMFLFLSLVSLTSHLFRLHLSVYLGAHFVFLQTLRAAVGGLLLYWGSQGFISQTLSFEAGVSNLVVGALAPLAAWYWVKKGRGARILILTWNTLSLIQLLVMARRVILTLPTPAQKFMDQPGAELMLTYPFCVLPLVIAPICLYLHFSTYVLLRKNPSVPLENPDHLGF